MRIMVIPTTDWTGHPVPNRLNFIFDNLAKKHRVDVCHFKFYKEKRRGTSCNLIPMDKEVKKGIKNYYLHNIFTHGKKISDNIDRYDIIVSANLIPSYFANFGDTPIIFDYLDHLPGSASVYYPKPLDRLARYTADRISVHNLKKADGIITPTNTFKRFLEDKTESPIVVIPNGVDLDKIKPMDPKMVEKRYGLGHPVLGYVGSLERWVDLESIIELFPDIKRRYKNAKLLIIGPGLHTDYAERLKSMVREMKLSDDVIFTGRIPYDDLPEYISALDIGLNPRKDLLMNRMTMGSKILTYLACGVPVLSTNMPEVEKQFGPKKGVFRYENEEEFLGELHKAICKRVKPEVVEDYGWKKISRRYEKVLLEFIS